MPIQNQLLAGLPPSVLSRILPTLRACPLTFQKTLFRPREPIGAVWFIESGYVSLMMTSAGGKQAEVGLIGPEGMVGQPLVLGVDSSVTEAVVQMSGTALRMEADTFRRAFDADDCFRSMLLRYTEAVYAQAAQAAACNGHHTVEQRLARWLLMALDRSGNDKLHTTHEQLASMLSVYRPSVTLAAQMLQRAGTIRYTRGNITILGRTGLEAMACDCYMTQKERFEHVMNARADHDGVIALPARARPFEDGSRQKDYRLHFLDATGRIVAVDTFHAVDTNEALETAWLVFDSCSDVLGGFELWCGADLIASDRHGRAGRLPNLDELAVWRQRNVCDREETLSSSFACIRESRKLLATLSHLKQRIEQAA